jgi:thioredoxin 1
MVTNYLQNKGIDVENINAFDDPDKASEFGIMSVPVVILLDDDGNEITRSIGFKPNELDEIIQQLS